MTNYIDHSKTYHTVRDTLQDVLDGNISRKDCSQGLCTVIEIDSLPIRPRLNSEEVLRGYKFWSGQKGYSIYIGETTEAGIAEMDYVNEAINQFKLEARCAGDKEFRDQYWEARLELARHWIRYIDGVIESSKK
ncbi:hypothetical protein phiAS5_ORF0174 [Aeromonas phage phiAS5]|uniref:Uncharacterized protein n=1 Tax=Aeromonas phage phiAS5 TaxID=879630 RepID=E1A2S1_9CAUD|nr:hypothetical protein phiAS5_ORF0174 [Aeromonas phage phiAS5]ADM80017.1 hypothetical protein phiAS5_ORF0174 [Aeromonas phage phiAS5]